MKYFRSLFMGVYILAFCEAFVRIYAPQPIMPRYVTSSPEGIRANIPNAQYTHITKDDTISFRINSLGMRSDSEYSLQKPPGVCRIALLGDSFFMGYEVELENSFAALLSNTLNSKGWTTEVLNFSVSGFGTAEHLIALERRALAYNPDIVIMEWHMTDISDNIRSGLFTVRKGELRQVKATFSPGTSLQTTLMKIPGYEWIILNLQSYSAIRETVAVKLKSLLEQSQVSMHIPETSNQTMPANNKLSELLILEAEQLTRKVGAEFYLFEIPLKKDNVQLEPSLKLLDTSLLKSINTVSPLKPMRDASKQGVKMYYDHGQGHWSISGNLVAALTMAEELEIHSPCAPK